MLNHSLNQAQFFMFVSSANIKASQMHQHIFYTKNTDIKCGYFGYLTDCTLNMNLSCSTVCIVACCNPSFIYSWPISQIWEYEYYWIGCLGSEDSIENFFNFDKVLFYFWGFCSYFSWQNKSQVTFSVLCIIHH